MINVDNLHCNRVGCCCNTHHDEGVLILHHEGVCLLWAVRGKTLALIMHKASDKTTFSNFYKSLGYNLERIMDDSTSPFILCLPKHDIPTHNPM